MLISESENSFLVDTPYEKLTLKDSFIFAKVMQTYKDICLRLLQIILPELNIEKIEDVETEKVLKHFYPNKGVRLDAYASDDSGRRYDLEMQVAEDKSLPKRARYYGSMMDANDLLKGMDYDKLCDAYVIFICNSDPFDEGKKVYSFRNYDLDNDIALNDGSVKIFLNPKGTEGEASPELQRFLDYLENEKQDTADAFLVSLNRAVEEARKNETWRGEYMTYKDIERRAYLIGEEKGLEKGLEKGMEKGLEAGLEKGVEKGRNEMADALISKGLVSREDLDVVMKNLEKAKQ